jgi:hypothetical protein
MMSLAARHKTHFFLSMSAMSDFSARSTMTCMHAALQRQHRGPPAPPRLPRGVLATHRDAVRVLVANAGGLGLPLLCVGHKQQQSSRWGARMVGVGEARIPASVCTALPDQGLAAPASACGGSSSHRSSSSTEHKRSHPARTKRVLLLEGPQGRLGVGHGACQCGCCV